MTIIRVDVWFYLRRKLLIFPSRFSFPQRRKSKQSPKSDEAIDEAAGIWKAMGMHNPRVGVAMANKVPPIFTYGTCMPSSCTAEDLRVRKEGVRVVRG